METSNYLRLLNILEKLHKKLLNKIDFPKTPASLDRPLNVGFKAIMYSLMRYFNSKLLSSKNIVEGQWLKRGQLQGSRLQNVWFSYLKKFL